MSIMCARRLCAAGLRAATRGGSVSEEPGSRLFRTTGSGRACVKTPPLRNFGVAWPLARSKKSLLARSGGSTFRRTRRGAGFRTASATSGRMRPRALRTVTRKTSRYRRSACR